MKKHSLAEHRDNVSGWMWDNLPDRVPFRQEDLDRDVLMIAYERWINDRPLLTDEDKTLPENAASPREEPSPTEGTEQSE